MRGADGYRKIPWQVLQLLLILLDTALIAAASRARAALELHLEGLAEEEMAIPDDVLKVETIRKRKDRQGASLVGRPSRVCEGVLKRLSFT